MALITAYGDSSATQSGTFVQGSTASFILKFFDILGHSFDPSSITVEILDPSDTVLDTISGITKIDVGEYAVDYTIESDATTGSYTLRYTFISETVSGSETRSIDEIFVVIQAGEAGSILTETQKLVMREYLETLIRTTQRIPVINEQVKWNKTRTLAKLTFGNWNQPAGAKVYRNNTLITSGFEIDYLKGEIQFDYALEDSDIVNVDYNFRWFTDTELSVFMSAAIMRLNAYPPVTNYTFGYVPNQWVFLSMYGAAIDAIRTLIMDLIHQQPQIVFGGPEMVQKILDVLDGQKKNFEEDLKTVLDLKKYGPYTGLTKMVIVPEMTLPGGRSRWFRYLFSNGSTG